jgi:hypothetical protein
MQIEMKKANTPTMTMPTQSPIFFLEFWSSFSHSFFFYKSPLGEEIFMKQFTY